MFEPHLLLSPSPGVNSVFGLWFKRRADRVLFTLDLVAFAPPPSPGVGALAVNIYTKNFHDGGLGGSATGSVVATSVGTYQFEASGLKELVRYLVSVSSSHSSVGTRAQFRMLKPSWFDAVKAGS